MAPFLAQSEPIAPEAATARVAPLTLNYRIRRSKDNTTASEGFITPHQLSTSSTIVPLPCVELWMFKCAVVGCAVVKASAVSDADDRRKQHEDDILLGLSQLGPLSRMAPQPHMMSDLRSSHQTVTTQTVQQLYNCGFSISVLTGT